jgi:hypothetical protein
MKNQRYTELREQCLKKKDEQNIIMEHQRKLKLRKFLDHQVSKFIVPWVLIFRLEKSRERMNSKKQGIMSRLPYGRKKSMTILSSTKPRRSSRNRNRKSTSRL